VDEQLISSLGEPGVVYSNVVTDLEVNGLNNNDCIKLAEVQAKITSHSRKK